MRSLVFVLLAGCSSFAAPDARLPEARFNGRWDITVLGEPRGRAWWLEIEGAGTPNLKGKFVGFPGGDLNEIRKIVLSNGELRFTFDREPQGGKGEAIHQVYTAHLAGEKLEGTFEAGNRQLKWEAVRAPENPDKDDGSWKPGKPVELFNHKNLEGWKGVVPGNELGWSVEDGLLKSAGGASNLETGKAFWNYDLRVEYKV